MKFLCVVLKMHAMLDLDVADSTLYRLVKSKSPNMLFIKCLTKQSEVVNKASLLRIIRHGSLRYIKHA